MPAILPVISKKEREVFHTPRKSTATMVDVAREAGVALGTVSKFVNGQPVSSPYRENIAAAIEKLGYQINTNGRALRSNHSMTIAFIIPNTINPYFALLVHHINMALEARNYKMLLCFTEYNRDRESEFIQMAVQNQLDGIIALTYNPHLVIPEGIPFVTIDRFFSASVPCVSSDNFAGGRMAALKLHELGCRKAIFMRTGSVLTNEPNKRRDGFVSACIELSLPFEVLAYGDEQPYSDFEDYLHAHCQHGRLDFDGIFCGTDMLAWQIIHSLRSMGQRVPEDVQVIGFDGIRMFGSLDYFVSTIVQPVAEIARTCVDTVLADTIASRPSLICLPVTYAPGGTTKERMHP